MKSGPRRLHPIERRAHDEVRARAAGIRVADLTPDTVAVDEILGAGLGVEFSHRIAAGRGGAYRPANGIWTSRAVHDFLHDNRALAEAGGWHLETGTCIQDAPVWLARPYPGWWRIQDLVTDGGPHVLEWCEVQLVRPRLPFESRSAYERHLAGLVALV